MEEQHGRARGQGTLDDVCDADITMNPALRCASLLLAIVTLIQVISTHQDSEGPLDWFAGALIPQFLSWGFHAGRDGDDYGMDGHGGMCPPDEWIDEAFVYQHNNEIYSEKYDPRNKVVKPSLFPHCALSRWVGLEEKHSCPEGNEYVTVIRPPRIAERSEWGGKIPRIMHISSPTNCLPSPTVRALRALTRQHISQAYTIYVHSTSTMDNILFRREWNVFPQVKEGVLCGSEKLKVTAQSTMRDQNFGNSTEQQRKIADEIALGVKRDFWRYMVLWEYGGVTLDVDALHEILGWTTRAHTLSSGANSSAAGSDKAYDALRLLMRQWSAEKRSDALLYFINNDGRQFLPYNERIPSTDVMAMAPNHPLIYYSAKIALRNAVFDWEKLITDVGRTTKIPPIRDGLKQLNRQWKNIKTGQVMIIPSQNENSIRFVDGDDVLPPSLTSPRTTPWRSIFAAFHSGGVENAPPEQTINVVMRHFAAEQKYIGPNATFSCMEYTLDMYLQKSTEK